jgi:hypothetical protein
MFFKELSCHMSLKRLSQLDIQNVSLQKVQIRPDKSEGGITGGETWGGKEGDSEKGLMHCMGELKTVKGDIERD